jgi:hypothetical protein
MGFSPVSSSNKGLYEDEIKPEGYFPMQYLRLIDNQLVTVSAVQIWFKFVQIIPKSGNK